MLFKVMLVAWRKNQTLRFDISVGPIGRVYERHEHMEWPDVAKTFLHCVTLLAKDSAIRGAECLVR